MEKRALQDEEVGISYMKSWEWERYIEKRSMKQGLEQGRKEGKEAGRQIELVSLVCQKIKKNCTVEAIADMLEQDEATIQRIYNTAVSYAPDYDLDKIIRQLNAK